LAQCRAKGYAVDPGELAAGITAVSAPFFGPGGDVIGCLILVGVISEEEVDFHGRMVVEGANKITRASGGSLSPPES
jgi:DNA-binding IclR family transcriptional regulator